MAQHKPQNTAEMYERAVAGKLLAERRALLEGWRRQGIDTLDVPANHLSPAIVGRYLELKRKGRI